MLKQLSAQDAQFLYTQTANNLTHIMGVYIYDPSTAPGGFVRFKDIIRHVESRVHTSPLFTRRLHRLPSTSPCSVRWSCKRLPAWHFRPSWSSRSVWRCWPGATRSPRPSGCRGGCCS